MTDEILQDVDDQTQRILDVDRLSGHAMQEAQSVRRDVIESRPLLARLMIQFSIPTDDTAFVDQQIRALSHMELSYREAVVFVERMGANVTDMQNKNENIQRSLDAVRDVAVGGKARGETRQSKGLDGEEREQERNKDIESMLPLELSKSDISLIKDKLEKSTTSLEKSRAKFMRDY